MLVFQGEGFEALADGFVLGSLLLLLLLLMLMLLLLLLLLLMLLLLRGLQLRLRGLRLRIREAWGDPRGGGAVPGRRPHRRLQHLHGVAPLAGGDGHLVQGSADVGEGVGVGGGVLPRSLRRPGFHFAVLWGKGWGHD